MVIGEKEEIDVFLTFLESMLRWYHVIVLDNANAFQIQHNFARWVLSKEDILKWKS